MGNSFVGRGHYGFEAALLSTGLIPKRDIREERRTRESLAKHAAELAIKRRDEYLRKFYEEHGESLADFDARKRAEAWEDLMGGEPKFDSDVIKWKDEVEKASTILRLHSEDYLLPEKNSGYFSFWIRRELLQMRGTRSQFSCARKNNFLKNVEKVRLSEGRWEFSILLDLCVLHHSVKSGDKYVANFLKHFPQEETPYGALRVWLPFGVVDVEMFNTLNRLPSKDSALCIRTWKEPLKSIREFAALHHVNIIHEYCPHHYVHLSRKFAIKSTAEKKEEKNEKMGQTLDGLWRSLKK